METSLPSPIQEGLCWFGEGKPAHFFDREREASIVICIHTIHTRTHIYIYIYCMCACVCVKSFSGVSTAWTITFGRPWQDLQRLIFMQFDKACFPDKKWFGLSCWGIVGITQEMMINKTKMHMIKSIRSRYTWGCLSMPWVDSGHIYLEMESVFHTQLSRRQV